MMASGFGTGTSSIQHLSTDEMVEAAQVFNEAYQHVLGNCVAEKQQYLQRFVAATVLTEKPFLLVTPEGLDHAIGMVFQDPAVRDFIFTLSYTFGARWGMSQERFEGLCANLAAGAAPTTALVDNAAPRVVADRLVSFADAYKLLLANPWLVMLMLLLLFGSAGSVKP